MLNFHDDPTAFDEFIRQHQDRVYNLVLKRVQNAEDAEEITQDVFVAVYRNPGAFRGEAAVTTWLFRIAMNKAIDHLRSRNSRRGWQIKRWFSGTEVDAPDEAVDFHHPGVASEEKEKASILFRVMKGLPERQYTAWILSETEGMSYREISQVMKVSVASVESLVFRARQNLKKRLSGLYPGD